MARAGQLAGLLSRFGPPLALMAVIFALSATPNLGTGLGTIDLIARKLAHMAEYGLLWLLWLRALRWRAPWTAAAIAIAYAISDELHQTTVEGRQGSPVDVLIDSAGVLVAAIGRRAYLRRRAAGNRHLPAGASRRRDLRSSRARWR